MNGRNTGFTLIEMLIVIVIFGFVLAGTSQMFVSTLTAHRQQSKIAETNIGGIIGLELLRRDLAKAGYGLPWNGLTAYSEAGSDPYTLNDAPLQTPRGIVSANNVTAGPALPGTDYLVIKATNVATNDACNKWTFLSSGATGTTTSWTPASENLNPNDQVIVLSPGVLTSSNARNLVTSGTLFSAVPAFADTSGDKETRVVYGLGSGANLRPFNRADYFIKIPTSGLPQRCAIGTGNLYKSVLNLGDGNMVDMPLLDCVADMQVIFRYDPLGNGVLVGIDDISTLTAAQVRDQVKEVRVYVLAHEGQIDKNYTTPSNLICIGCDSTVGLTGSLGRNIDLSVQGIANWQNYRWKLYTLVVKLDNLL